MAEADTSELEATVAFLKRKIKTTRQAIGDVEKKIREYSSLAKAGGGEYDAEALEESVAHAEKQVSGMKKEIDVTRTQITEVRQQIEYIERVASVAEGVTIDASDE